MSRKVIFKTPENTVAILFPCLECGLTVEQIANKDLPKGTPYFILDDSQIPDISIYPQESWVVDFTSASISTGVNPLLTKPKK